MFFPVSEVATHTPLPPLFPSITPPYSVSISSLPVSSSLAFTPPSPSSSLLFQPRPSFSCFPIPSSSVNARKKAGIACAERPTFQVFAEFPEVVVLQIQQHGYLFYHNKKTLNLDLFNSYICLIAISSFIYEF